MKKVSEGIWENPVAHSETFLLFYKILKLQLHTQRTNLLFAKLSLEELHNFYNRNYQNTKADGNQVFG